MSSIDARVDIGHVHLKVAEGASEPDLLRRRERGGGEEQHLVAHQR